MAIFNIWEQLDSVFSSLTSQTFVTCSMTFVGKVMSLLFNTLSKYLCRSFSSKEQKSFNYAFCFSSFHSYT